MVVVSRKVRSIKDLVEECVTDLSCKVVTVNRMQTGLVVRVEDGTCSEVLSVEYRGLDTHTQEEAGNNKHFIDLWVENKTMVDRMMEMLLVAGDWIRMENVKCVKEGEGGEEFPDVFRFLLEDGGISRLGEEDVEVAFMIERIWESDKTGDLNRSIDDQYNFNETDDGSEINKYRPLKRKFAELSDINNDDLSKNKKLKDIFEEVLTAQKATTQCPRHTSNNFSSEQNRQLASIFCEVFEFKEQSKSEINNTNTLLSEIIVVQCLSCEFSTTRMPDFYVNFHHCVCNYKSFTCETCDKEAGDTEV